MSHWKSLWKAKLSEFILKQELYFKTAYGKLFSKAWSTKWCQPRTSSSVLLFFLLGFVQSVSMLEVCSVTGTEAHVSGSLELSCPRAAENDMCHWSTQIWQELLQGWETATRPTSMVVTPATVAHWALNWLLFSPLCTHNTQEEHCGSHFTHKETKACGKITEMVPSDGKPCVPTSARNN